MTLRHAPVPDLPTVGLDELTATAALQTRVDRKYALDRTLAERVLAGLPTGTRVLEADGIRALAYASVYFDTPDLASFRMAAHGRRRRFKLRTRAYLDAGDAFLEVKTRGARSRTVKERVAYDIRDAERLTGDGRAYAAERLAEVGVEPLDLAPVLASSYRRTTLLQPAGGGRATVDTDLAWRDTAGGELRRPDLVIVETKSLRGASPIDRMLWAAGVRPVALSKYATGLAALRPGLPTNKWARVLRRHF